MKAQELEQEAQKELDEEKRQEVKSILKKMMIKIENRERELVALKKQYQECLEMDIFEAFQKWHEWHN